MNSNFHPNVSAFHTPSVSFEVFRAKYAETSKWEDGLENVVLEARKSYVERYGNVSLLDSSDEHAVVYLVRAQYTDQARLVEEWLSARFVLTKQLTPEGAHKLIQSTCCGQPLLQILKQPEKLAVVSRICGYLKEEGREEVRRELQHTSYAFALMVKQFCIDYAQDGNLHFIVGLFRNELVEKSLQRNVNEVLLPSFYFGPKLIPGVTRDQFSIDRSMAAYQFPGYFLETPALQKLLRQLIEEDLLERELVAGYLPDPKDIDNIMNGVSVSYRSFCRMGEVFTSENIRRRIDENVPDGPELRVIDIQEWEGEFPLLMKNISLPTT